MIHIFEHFKHIIQLHLAILVASRQSENYLLGRRKTKLIIDGKVTEPRRVDSGIPQGSPITPFLFLINTSSLYNKIREAGAHVVGYSTT